MNAATMRAELAALPGFTEEQALRAAERLRAAFARAERARLFRAGNAGGFGKSWGWARSIVAQAAPAYDRPTPQPRPRSLVVTLALLGTP